MPTTLDSDRRMRALRGVLASSVATGAALASHVLAGGRVPVPALVVAALVLCWPVGVVLIGRRPSLLRQTLTIGAAEAALHVLFAIGVAAGRMPAGHHAAGAAPEKGMPAHAGSAMLPAHLVAALVTVVAWRQGEAAIAAVVRTASTAVVRLLRLPLDRVPTVVGHAVPAVRVVVPRLAERLLTVDPLRGPPAFLR